jgi:hypothetical protein
LIGCGAFSKVYEAWDSKNNKYAIKVFYKNKNYSFSGCRKATIGKIG